MSRVVELLRSRRGPQIAALALMSFGVAGCSADSQTRFSQSSFSNPFAAQEATASVPTPAVERDHAQGVVDSMTVLGAMDGLSNEHREVLVEIYYRGRTVAEAARTLGVAPGTVKSRSYYALRALRAAMISSGTEVAR